MKLKSFSKKLLPLSFALCLANSSVLASTNTVVKTQQQTATSGLQKDALNDPDLSERMKKLILKYNKDFDYEKLNDEEKYELFEVQGKFFQNLGYNPYLDFDYEGKSNKGNRALTEWYGANLWINLSLSETKWWIANLKKNYHYGMYASAGFGAISQATNAASEVKKKKKKQYLLKIISLLAGVARFYAHYFDWQYLTKLADKGPFHTISYRFTFGFIPTGVFKGYREVPEEEKQEVTKPKANTNHTNKNPIEQVIDDVLHFVVDAASWLFRF